MEQSHGELALLAAIGAGQPVPITPAQAAELIATENRAAAQAARSWRPQTTPALQRHTDGYVITPSSANDAMFRFALCQLKSNTDSGEETEYYCRCFLQWLRDTGPSTAEAIEEARRAVQGCADSERDQVESANWDNASRHQLRYAAAMDAVAIEIGKLPALGGER